MLKRALQYSVKHADEFLKNVPRNDMVELWLIGQYLVYIMYDGVLLHDDLTLPRSQIQDPGHLILHWELLHLSTWHRHVSMIHPNKAMVFCGSKYLAIY